MCNTHEVTPQAARTAAQRPTIVLLHSSASSARQWHDLIGMLEPRFRVHAVDFHGHGARRDWRGVSPLTLADELALVAPLLADAGGAHVVGHSYGAAVALKLATMYPRLVHSLVAYEPVLFRLLLADPASREPAQDFIAVGEFIRDRLAQNEPALAAKRFIEFWSGAGAWDALPVGPQHAVANRMKSVFAHFDTLVRDSPQRDQLVELRMPMLFLTGARTVPAARRIGDLLRTALPTAQHDTLAGMGHMGPITHAADVNRRIATFLYAQTASESAPQRWRLDHRSSLGPAPQAAFW